MGRLNIRVNVVCPYAETESIRTWREWDPKTYERTVRGVPMGRLGDVVTDTAIELIRDANTITYTDTAGAWLAMRSGAKLPFAGFQDFDACGNAANAAVAGARLGLRATLAADIGKDDTGQRIVARLQEHGVDTHLVRVHPDQHSNHHFLLRHGAERTILVKHHEFAYRWSAPAGSAVPEWVYFSSLSEHAGGYQDEIAAWLTAHPGVRLAFQPGTLQIRAGVAPLRTIYRRAEIVIMNREEAVSVTGGDHADVHDLLVRLHELGPTNGQEVQSTLASECFGRQCFTAAWWAI